MNRLTTDLTVPIGGYEKTFPKLVVEYTHHRAYSGFVRGEPINPPEPEHVEIGCVYIDRGDGARDPLPEWMIEILTPDLEAMCLEDWREADGYARESAAEMRRLDVHKLAAAE